MSHYCDEALYFISRHVLQFSGNLMIFLHFADESLNTVLSLSNILLFDPVWLCKILKENLVQFLDDK